MACPSPASSARYIPAAQPSVAARRASSVSSSTALPFSRNSSLASSRLSASCGARNTSSDPEARSLPRGSGGSSRDDSTSCAPGGTWSMTKPRISQQVFARTRCASSRTRRNGPAAARLASSAGRIRVRIGVIDARRPSKTAGSTAVRPWSACARYVNSTTGSLSDVSSCSQAPGRSSASIHCTRVIVLPEPAGAETTISGAVERRRAAMSSLRGTTSRRDRGICRFETSGLNDERAGALRLATARLPL